MSKDFTEQPKADTAAITDFLREMLPRVFLYTEFQSNPLQSIKQYKLFAKEATETAITEVQAFFNGER